eukprot:1063524-Rhodomonas_salina.1
MAPGDLEFVFVWEEVVGGGTLVVQIRGYPYFRNVSLSDVAKAVAEVPVNALNVSSLPFDANFDSLPT